MLHSAVYTSCCHLANAFAIIGRTAKLTIKASFISSYCLYYFGRKKTHVSHLSAKINNANALFFIFVLRNKKNLKHQQCRDTSNNISRICTNSRQCSYRRLSYPARLHNNYWWRKLFLSIVTISAIKVNVVITVTASYLIF